MRRYRPVMQRMPVMMLEQQGLAQCIAQRYTPLPDPGKGPTDLPAACRYDSSHLMKRDFILTQQ